MDIKPYKKGVLLLSQCQKLQEKADEYLILNPAVLQILFQINHANMQLQQAALRASNHCGCIHLTTAKPDLPKEATWQDLKNKPTGDELNQLCPECKGLIKDKMGRILFYLAALGNAFDISLDDVIDQEISHLDLLGYFMIM